MAERRQQEPNQRGQRPQRMPEQQRRQQPVQNQMRQRSQQQSRRQSQHQNQNYQQQQIHQQNQRQYRQSGQQVMPLTQQIADLQQRVPEPPESIKKAHNRVSHNTTKMSQNGVKQFDNKQITKDFNERGVLDRKTKTKRVLRMRVLSEKDTDIANKKVRGSNFRYRFIITFCLALMLVGTGIELWYLAEVTKTSHTFSDLSNTYTTTWTPSEEPFEPQADLSQLPPIVDFAGLQAVNPEISSWLKIPNTTVDYPVLSSPIEEKYLNLDMYGDYSISGSIFTDYENTLPLEDEQHIVLYGHHMIAPIMFNNVSQYSDYDFFQSHKTIYFETPETTYVLMPIGTYTADPSEYVTRQSNFVNGMDFQTYLDERLARCDFVDIEGLDRRCMDKLFTMITCTATGNARVVVECVPVAVYPTSYIPNVIEAAAWNGEPPV